MALSENARRAFPAEWPPFLRSVAIPLLVGRAGAAVTGPTVSSWYPTLAKPDFTPPGWVFGPVWTTLYLLMGTAEYLVSRRGVEIGERRTARVAYGLQLGLNALWSLLFFGLKSPRAALIEIGLLWLAIVLTIVAFARISKRAALLLVPYLLWVSFAAILNGEIWRLNR
jgi:benzodiazapine receptor